MTTPGADIRAFGTHDRTVLRCAQSLRHPDPEPLDDVHERRAFALATSGSDRVKPAMF